MANAVEKYFLSSHFLEIESISQLLNPISYMGEKYNNVITLSSPKCIISYPYGGAVTIPTCFHVQNQLSSYSVGI